MAQRFKLYWVETPSPDENCFVAARSKRAAERYEEDGTGFDPNDCKATEIRVLEDRWVRGYREADENDDLTAPFYVQPEDVHQLGIEWRNIEGDDVFLYEGRSFLKQGDLNYLASLSDNA